MINATTNTKQQKQDYKKDENIGADQNRILNWDYNQRQQSIDIQPTE